MLLLLPFIGLITSALATGYFTNPAGNDGSLTVKTGDTIDISWTNITDYDIFSVGYFSGSNQTITWLISDSSSQPTTYRWTVDAVAQGFNLAESSFFAFYACKDYNFGDPFVSSYFIISDDSASSSSSTSVEATSTTSSTSKNTATETSNLPSIITPSNTPTDTGTAPTASATGTTVPAAAATTASNNTNIVSTSSSDLSTGAKAGIAVGVIVGVLGFAAAAFMFFRQRKQRQRSAVVPGGSKSVTLEAPSEPGTNAGENSSAYEKAQMKAAQDAKYAAYTPVHEAPGSSPGGHDEPVELGSGTRDDDGRAELPSVNER